MVRRRGGRPRKDGPRGRNGRLRWQPALDRGHEAMVSRRQDMVGEAAAREAMAGYPLGVLALRGLLADPHVDQNTGREQTEARLRAGIWLAVDRAIVWGMATPKSHLAAFLIAESTTGHAVTPRDERAAEMRYDRKIRTLLELPWSKPTALTLVNRIVIEEEYAISSAELATLRNALDALAAV